LFGDGLQRELSQLLQIPSAFYRGRRLYRSRMRASRVCLVDRPTVVGHPVDRAHWSPFGAARRRSERKQHRWPDRRHRRSKKGCIVFSAWLLAAVLLAVAFKAGFKHEKSLQAYDAEACSTIDYWYQAMQDSQEQSGTADWIPRARIEEVLEVALRHAPPPSLRDVSLSLSLQDASWLVNRFHVQCRLLVQRSKGYSRNRRLGVETVLKTALIEEPPPTVKEVAKRVALRSCQMRVWFPSIKRPTRPSYGPQLHGHPRGAPAVPRKSAAGRNSAKRSNR